MMIMHDDYDRDKVCTEQGQATGLEGLSLPRRLRKLLFAHENVTKEKSSPNT